MADSGSERNPVDVLAEEFVARCRGGEAPSVSEFVERCPDLADEIRGLFPALLAMEQAAPVTGGEANDTARNGPDVNGQRFDRVGDFRILREIGRGGMGVVYEAEQESLGRHVALKVLPGHPAMSSHALERFRRESRAAANLHHTNIVPVYSVGEDRGVHYYAMQYIRGQTLASVLDELRRLPRGVDANAPTLTGEVARSLLAGDRTRTATAGEPPTAVAPSEGSGSAALSRVESQYFRSVARVGVQVAEALSHAHGQGVLHRDIKPGNLLIDTQGVVWVTDFGLAKAEGTDDLTNPGDILGTLRYMAPERLDGKSDARSDVYALGLTLYEMVTLQPAFTGTSRADLIDKVRREDPVPPRRLAPQVPRDLETIILKASMKEPDRRYPTAAALADDLRLFLADRTILARRATAFERGWRWARRNPAVATLIAAIALLLATGLPLVTVLWLRAAREAERAEHRRQEAEANLTLARTAVDDSFTMVSEDVLLKSPLPGLQPLRRHLLQASLKYYQEFARRNADDPTQRANLAAAYLRLGKITAEIGSPEEAVKHLRQAASMFEELARLDPARWEHRASRGEALAHLGHTAAEQDRLDDALAHLNDAIELLDPLDRDHPDDVRLRSVLGFAYHYLGRLLSTQRPRPETWSRAEDSNLRAIELRQSLADRHPDHVGYASDLSLSLSNWGYALSQAGRAQEAVTFVRRANTLQRELVRKHPLVADLRYRLSLSTRGLGHLLRNSGRRDEAVPLFRESAVILERVVTENPAVNLYRSMLAMTRAEFGQELADQGEVSAALGEFAKAQAGCEELERVDPGNPSNLNTLASVHRGIGKVRGKQGDTAGALAGYRQAAELGERIAGKRSLYTYDWACSVALCAEAAAALPAGQPGGGPAEAKRYADRAVEVLKRAVADGWRDVDGMARDLDLTSIRDRPDFKDLLASLRQPAKD